MGEPGTLIKFGKQEHLLRLQAEGALYLNTPEYFWQIEDEELRGDPFDCIAKVARGPKIVIPLPDGKQLSMEGEWVYRMYPPEPEKINIFCMFALRPLIEGNFPIDKRNFKFGDYALFLINPNEFMRRVQSTLKNEKINYKADLAEYVDDKYIGELGPFKKLKRFAYQSEWRLVCPEGPSGPSEILIGDIRDISVILRSDEINELIKVEFEPINSRDPSGA